MQRSYRGGDTQARGTYLAASRPALPIPGALSESRERPCQPSAISLAEGAGPIPAAAAPRPCPGNGGGVTSGGPPLPPPRWAGGRAPARAVAAVATRGPAGGMAAAAEAAGGGSSRHEKSLGLLTTKFVSLLQEAKDGVLDLKLVRGQPAGGEGSAGGGLGGSGERQSGAPEGQALRRLGLGWTGRTGIWQRPVQQVV